VTDRSVNFQYYSLHPKKPGIKSTLRSLFKRVFPKIRYTYHDTYLVVANGHKFKLLILGDSYMTARIATNLKTFSSFGIFPDIVGVYDNEIWLEFIEGNIIDKLDHDVINKMAHFYSVLFNKAPEKVSATEFGFVQKTHKNLKILNKLDFFTDDIYTNLDRKLINITPEDVWIGYDYTDPFLGNFILTPERNLLAIDVESVYNGRLLGTGIAKALALWPDQYGEKLFQEVCKLPIPDFRPYFTFVEISCLAEWVVRSVLQQRRPFVDSSYFDKFK
jgi:hypothetical protein